MSLRFIFRISGWLAGTAVVLLVVNVAGILFVLGTDIFLGQPPQYMATLFAVLVSSLVLVVVHRSTARAARVVVDDVAEAESRSEPRRRAAQQAPAYLSMTIIRRPAAQAPSGEAGRVM